MTADWWPVADWPVAAECLVVVLAEAVVDERAAGEYGVGEVMVIAQYATQFPLNFSKKLLPFPFY